MRSGKYTPQRQCQYINAEWIPVRMRTGMNDQQIIAAWRERYKLARVLGFSPRDVYDNRLDNPFASIEAMYILVNDMKLMRRHRESRKKFGRFTSMGVRKAA